MKILFILLLILYILLFYPIKLNLEYYKKEEVIVRLIIFDIIIIPFRYIIKGRLITKNIRKFLFNIKKEKESFLKKIEEQNFIFKEIIKHITLNYIDIIFYTDKTFKVGSYYFICNILSGYLNNVLYSVNEEKYQLFFDINEHIYFNSTISIKLYHIVIECLKNINMLKDLLGRRLNSGKSN
jgi:hypothetical protein